MATAGPVRWLVELESTAEELMNRHLSSAREWFPHQYVPWSLGRDFEGPLGGEPWRPEQSAIGPAVRSALVVNLLTEDNLPGYHWRLLRALKVLDRGGLGPAGEQARERIAEHLEGLDARAARFVERRAQALAVPTALSVSSGFGGQNAAVVLTAA
ncbi:acyl-ACP desaturase [Kitasatospora sp. NPDC048722]|uniref:acyl-ACP desaturase n=1 Tax=Kitasatospora sp. NPDC048722 TaxID=3155639 RepID=UPI00340E18A0